MLNSSILYYLFYIHLVGVK